MFGELTARLQYWLAYALLFTFGSLPRSLAYPAANGVAWLGFHLAARQRRAGFANLDLAMPGLAAAEKSRIVLGVFRNLGRLLVEFSHFPDLNKANIEDLVVYDGLDNYRAAASRGKGVLILTAHLGPWELAPFAHSIYGYPMHFLVRPIDNPHVDRLIRGYRSRAGNTPIDKNQAVRDVLRALRSNQAVGLLIDQNTTRDEGLFVDFFGIPAATTKGLATFALRSGAPVVPGFLTWDEIPGKYQLRFDPALETIETGDSTADVRENTRLYNQVIERHVRRHPDQWLWIHRRWKTRPEGDPPLY